MILQDSRLVDLISILVSILVVFELVYFMHRNLFINSPLIYGDAGISNLNNSVLYTLGYSSPWFNIIYIISFHYFNSYFGFIYNNLGLIPIFLMPASMYFLLKKLEKSVVARIAGSILYVVNPIVMVWGGSEYGGPLLFLPLIAISVLSYIENGKTINLLYAAILFFLLETFLGVPEIKLVLPFLIAFILILLIKNFKKNLLARFADILLAVFLSVTISLPLILNIGSSFIQYSNAFSQSSNLYYFEKGLVEYVFQSSNIQNSFMGLNIYSGTYLQTINYGKSWSSLIWFLVVLSSTISASLYAGKFRLFYRALLILLGIFVIFQFGVYTGTFLWFYHSSLVVIYNYPLFFDEMQMFIYSIFFAEFIEVALKKIRRNSEKISLKWFKLHTNKIIAVLAIIVIIFASLPILVDSNGDGALNSNPAQYAMPHYWDSIITDLASYQNYKTLVLPNNDTTLTYLDAAMPYTQVYGLPYNFQAFPNEFPKVSVFSNLSNDFASNNVSGVSNILLNQSIGLIVVVNMESNLTITSLPTAIYGGGKYFSEIVNSTKLYSIVKETPQYILYKYNYNFNKTANVKLTSSIHKDTKYKSISNSSSSLYITTGNYSHIAIPITLGNAATVNPYYYQQKIFIERNVSSLINNNFTNLYFAYRNETLIPAWIQSINESGSVVWIRLLSNTTEIYLWVFPKYYDLLSSNGYLGEAPQLSNKYGQYDNGGRVFNFYYNFSNNSTTNENFYSTGTSNYTLHSGLYLGSGATLNSYAQLYNGILFGGVDYETSDTFGSGSADVAHAIYLRSSEANNFEDIDYDTYSHNLEFNTYSHTYIDNNFHFNTLYNFSIYANGGIGKMIFGNFSRSVSIEHNSSFSIMLINQPDNGNNGTMYIPYLAYAGTVAMPDYSFGKAFVQQEMFNNLSFGNPGDVNTYERFIAYAPNIKKPLTFTWIIENESFTGQSVNVTFSEPGNYVVRLQAYNPINNTTMVVNYSETIVRQPSVQILNLNKVKMGMNSFVSEVYNGTGAFSYLWYLDGNVISEGNENLTYSFNIAGNYTLQLYVIDSGGGIASSTFNVTILIPHRNASTINIWMAFYNAFTLPFALLFLVQGRLRLTAKLKTKFKRNR